MVHKVASSKKLSNDEKINQLASIIVRHEKLVGPNKTSAYSTRFSSESNAKLLKLANLFSTSKHNIIVMAVNAMYAKHF